MCHGAPAAAPAAVIIVDNSGYILFLFFTPSEITASDRLELTHHQQCDMMARCLLVVVLWCLMMTVLQQAFIWFSTLRFSTTNKNISNQAAIVD